ncbi:DUF3325 family protein [Pseudomonas kilonensis]|uniref:DUF3325 family protein n=1 Tax=Pseudomonas kilonensis TaxID=132476 RepID=UPI0009B8712E|nr:DUF3325 family protein [Pseudomonas kilonensis]
MADGLLSIAAFGLMVLGFCALALSQIAHYRRVTPHLPFPGTRVLRCSATLLLASSLLVSMSSQGVAMGAVIWTLAIPPSGIGVTMMLCGCKHTGRY